MKKLPLADHKQNSNHLILKRQLDASTFHLAIKYCLKLAQFFSFFPIYLGGESHTSLKFRWFYWRLLYSLITFSVFLMEFGLIIYQTFTSPLDLINMKVLFFHLGGLVQYILFFKLTRNWPNFVKEWHKLEIKMRNYEIIGNLRIRLICLTYIIMIIAGIEHSLVNAYKLMKCLEKEPTVQEAFRKFFISAYTYVFDVLQYSIWLGTLIQFTNLQRTFNWSYADVFIMLMGCGFTYRVKQITKRIENLSRLKISDMSQWAEVRRDYIRLSELCLIINKRISSIIITCYLLNLYFVLIQLFSSLKTIVNVVEKIYFYMSFGLLILRIMCVCFFGGSVYEEWQNIKFALNSVCSTAYNIEVDRLVSNVNTCELTLSGKNFFYISRGLVLKIAGAIVTYELVLIQFYQNALKEENFVEKPTS